MIFLATSDKQLPVSYGWMNFFDFGVKGFQVLWKRNKEKETRAFNKEKKQEHFK